MNNRQLQQSGNLTYKNIHKSFKFCGICDTAIVEEICRKGSGKNSTSDSGMYNFMEAAFAVQSKGEVKMDYGSRQ